MENEGQVERRAKHLSNESCLAVTLLNLLFHSQSARHIKQQEGGRRCLSPTTANSEVRYEKRHTAKLKPGKGILISICKDRRHNCEKARWGGGYVTTEARNVSKGLTLSFFLPSSHTGPLWQKLRELLSSSGLSCYRD